MLGSLLAATAVLALLTILPGPDMAVVTRVALTSGRSAAARTAVGVATGLAVWGLLTVAGLAAVLAASSRAYTVVKLAGAAYLVVLGVVTLLHRSRDGGPADGPDAGPTATAGAFRAGLLTNLLNPKIAVFYTGLLPQLVPEGSPETVTLLGLVAVHVVLGLAWLNVYAAALHRARSSLGRPPVRRALDVVTGSVLIGFGLRVAIQER